MRNRVPTNAALLVLAALLVSAGALAITRAMPPEIGNQGELAASDTIQDPPSRRLVQVRLFDADGSLLLSSYPGERGSLELEDARRKPGDRGAPYPWNPQDPPPLFRPIAALLEQVPDGATLKLSNLTLPTLQPERIRLNRTVDLHLSGSLSKAEAQEIFGNRTSGDVRYLGQIPASLLEEGDLVRYSLRIQDNEVFPVALAEGLRVRATLSLNGAQAKLSLEPDAAFEIHRNCKLPAPILLPPGYYVVEQQDEATLALARYPSQQEYEFQNRVVGVEFLFSSAGDRFQPTIEGDAP